MDKTTAEVVDAMMNRLREIESETIQQVESAFITALQTLGRDIEANRDYIEQETREWLYKMSSHMEVQYNFQIMMAKYDDKTSND